jgi:hypothetical protein
VFPLLLSSAGVGLAQTVDTTLWVSDGAVLTIVPDGNTIYIGGNFKHVGPITGGGAAIDSSTGLPQRPYAKVEGTVRAVASDGSGGWYVGGAFTTVRGQPRNNLAHLDASGRLTAWDPNANGEVDVLAVTGGTVYAGGGFTSIGGQPRNFIAALDTPSGAATDWNPTADDSLKAIAVSGSTVYIGGNFRNVGGYARNFIAALDAATGAANEDFDPNADYIVSALTVSGGTVYAGGGFSSIGGEPRSCIAALDAATGAATAWNPNSNAVVYCLAMSGATVYASGNFTSIGGQARNYIAALDVASGAATAWNPNSNGTIYALASSGGTVYAAGDFNSIGGQKTRIAALDGASGAARAWNPDAFGDRASSSINAPVREGTIYALAVSGGAVYAGGNVTSIGGRARNSIAALDATTGAATAWNPNLIRDSSPLAGAPVSALAVDGGTVYAGGGFIGIGGEPRNKIAALDAASGAATSWNPDATGGGAWGSMWSPAVVYDLAVSGGTVYACGTFTGIGGQPRYKIAALDALTGTATAWDPYADCEPFPGRFDSYVRLVEVSGSTVYASGFFLCIGGQPRSGFAAFDATTGAVAAWNPGGGVFALAVRGGTVYVGGEFTSIAGQPRNHLAALDGTTGTATAWNPNALGNQPYAPVFAMAVSGGTGTVYAGGEFTSIGGQTRNYVAALDPATGAALAWDPNANGSVRALAVYGGKVYVGGVFTSIGGQPQSGIAAITEGYLAAVGGDPSINEGSLTVVPNPTRARMQIRYSVIRSGRVRLELLDVSGRVEATLADRVQEPGRHVATWDGVGRRGRLSPGLHFLRLVSRDGVIVRKLAIVR